MLWEAAKGGGPQGMIQQHTIMWLPQKPVLVIDFPNLRQLSSKEVRPPQKNPLEMAVWVTTQERTLPQPYPR